MAFVTCADNVIDPPEALREDGFVANDETVGFTGRIEAADADWGSEYMESVPTNTVTAPAPKTRRTLMTCSSLEGCGQQVGAQRWTRIVDQRLVNRSQRDRTTGKPDGAQESSKTSDPIAGNAAAQLARDNRGGYRR